MKNLPEKDFWNAVRERLQNYAEEPRDDWDKIAGALPASGSADSTGFSIASDYLGVISLLMLLLIFGTDRINGKTLSSTLAVVESKASGEKQSDLEASTATTNVRPGAGENSAAAVDAREGSRDAGFLKNDPRTTSAIASVVVRNDSTLWTNDVQSSLVPNGHSDDTHQANVDVVVEDDSVRNVAESDTTAYPTQPEKKKVKKKFRPSVYFLLTPSMGYQKITPLKNDDVHVVGLNSPGIISANRFGYQLEAGLQKLLTPRLELYAGVSFYRQQQTVSYRHVSSGAAVVEKGGGDWSYEVTPGTATKQFRYDMQNMGVSMGLLYYLHGKLLMHKIGGGVQYMQGLRGSSPEGAYNNANSRYLHYQLLYRMEYAVNPRLSLFLQPTFTHTILSREQLAEPFTIKPYRAGLGIGLFYHF